MADLDDLLGDGPASPAPPAAGGGIDDLDDLLGGGGADESVNALDDDLLFGGGGAASPTAPKAPPQMTQQSGPLNLPKISNQVSDQLKPFVNDEVLYARFIQQLFGDMSRSRRVLTINPKSFVIMEASGEKLVREVDIQRLFGVVIQRKPLSKRLGTSKETELQYLFQIDGDADLMFALPPDPANGDTTHVPSAENVLTTIIASWGLNLPVALIPDGTGDESLAFLVRWKPTPDVRVRHALTESLAYRSELQMEVDDLRKKNSTLDINIMQIKSSAEGQTTGTVTQEIANLEDAISAFKVKLTELQDKKRQVTNEKETITAEMSQEEKRRDEAIRDKVRGEEQEQLLRRAKEFELMKASHRRDMDKLSFLTGLYEEHVRNKASDTYSGVQLTIRLEELEEEQQSLQGHHHRQQEAYTDLMSSLKEVKKRIALARDVQERLDADIQVLKDTPLDAELPSGLDHTEIPDITVVSRESDNGAALARKASVLGAASPPPKTAAATPTPVKKPIILDDDDDI